MERMWVPIDALHLIEVILVDSHFILDIVTSLGTVVALGAFVYQFAIDKQTNVSKQASLISVWKKNENINQESSTYVIISNSSELPIYEVVLSIDRVTDYESKLSKTSELCTFVQIVPPGRYKVPVIDRGGGMNMMFEASISFRDSSGKYWYRDASGHLKRNMTSSSIKQRELDLPIVRTSIELCECKC